MPSNSRYNLFRKLGVFINTAKVNSTSRLREVLRHWFAAAENYSDIEEFRIAINACIQAARNVTFVLQSNKRHIDFFDDWYGSWQAEMAADPIMKWCVSARNHIVKKGDLESLSVAKVLLFNSHAEPAENVLAVDPMLTGQEIAEIVKNKYLPDVLKETLNKSPKSAIIRPSSTA